jgi:heme-degrading monooxygenase HmoA
MIVVSNRLHVAKGHEADFEKRFEGRARLVENMPGFVRLEILRPVKSDYYIVLTHWQDEGSFQAWTNSAEFKEAHRNRPPSEIFSGPNVFEMHEVIQSAGKS